MSEILLTTLNARYAHASFGLRYLLANLGPLGDRAEIVEFDISQRSVDVLERILARSPRIVGVGVYIWNIEPATRLVGDLKRVRPDITVILGGPEVSYETEQQEIARAADYVIRGEGDLAFADLCAQLLEGKRPLQRFIDAPLPEFATAQSAISNRQLAMPYDLYTAEDIAHRVIYVEASRGCPFKCEFCLSSLDVPLRGVPLDDFLPAMQRLLDRGCRQFKFVDRTFNLNLAISRRILEFFRERYTPGLFLHFEMIPDRLPEALREPIRGFPAGALQFEVGIQTFNELVAERISRRQDNARVEENLRFLRQQTGVHVHADLIVGLPGEDIASFAAGFDRLVALQPQEIQVGILKRLRGTPIVRHDVEWQMVYSVHPPYEVLSTRTMDFATIQRMRRFARFWDLIVNSGQFPTAAPLIWRGRSPFTAFAEFSDVLHERLGRTHQIALSVLAEELFRYLARHIDPAEAGAALARDYVHGRRETPDFLRPYAPQRSRAEVLRSASPPRQARHLRGSEI